MKWLAWLPAVAWAAVLLLLGRREFGPDPLSWSPPDKLIHFVLYGVLGLLLGLGWSRTGARLPPLPIILIGALIGLYDEWQQRFVPGRSSDAVDWIMDALGVTLGFLWVVLLRRRRARPGSNE